MNRKIQFFDHTTFNLVTEFEPRGDQPYAIKSLCDNLNSGIEKQVLLGVTGSGKTFTIANVIAEQNRPTLVIAPNKTLAAQLCAEFKAFFPHNHVHYFVSYYDYYQPEAYIPATDTYIEKEATINDIIDAMRHAATQSLLEYRDTIIVSSVSCIYGIGSPKDYVGLAFKISLDEQLPREDLICKLVELQYRRNDSDFARGTFRVCGDTIAIFPADEDTFAYRITYFGDTIEEIEKIDAITQDTVVNLRECYIYPTSHYVVRASSLQKAIISIRKELRERVKELEGLGKFKEAQRLLDRTEYDLALLKETGFCSGIENYSRHLDGRPPGTPPATLIDYFPDDFLLVIDESHITLPQLRAMYAGDRSRKQTLIDYGFRLPSAIDNRPLLIDEFWEKVGQTIFVSATPGDTEISLSNGIIVEQIIRPTGLLDPVIEVRPAQYQVDDLIKEIRKVIARNERVLALTLTKKMAEALADYLREVGIKCRYLHSDIDTLDRVDILKGLRKKEFDVLIGINLLREGLDLPEVSLVAILDADKEGFLRSKRSLIQIIGRAARHVNGRAILYADHITDSMKAAIDETNRRRKKQKEFNRKFNIIPRSVVREIENKTIHEIEEELEEVVSIGEEVISVPSDKKAQSRLIAELKQRMLKAAEARNFELAAQIRDALYKVKEIILMR